MRNRVQGEVLPPLKPRFSTRSASNKQTRSEADNLELLARVLDDWFRIPGTQIRFGFDAILGLIPGVGDLLTGVVSCVLIFSAWMRGLPYVTLLRMVINVAIDVIVGSIPFIGDIFDLAWKANRRNYELIQRHIKQPYRHTWKDWGFLALLIGALGAILAVPLTLVVWLTMHLLGLH